MALDPLDRRAYSNLVRPLRAASLSPRAATFKFQGFPVQKSGLTLSTSTIQNIVLVRMAGYLDGHTFMELEKHIDSLIKHGQKRLVLDLSELGYIASAGVGLFINTQHRLKDDGSVQLVNPSPGVREIFNILGLETIFTIHPSVAAGVAAAQA